jgi:hypothetical protein
MLRAFILVLMVTVTGSDAPRSTNPAQQCNPAPAMTLKGEQHLAQQCVQGDCCGQQGCWVKCPCW